MLPEDIQLLHCPFCGEAAALKVHSGAYFQWVTWVECKRCRAKSLQMVFGNNGSLRPEDCNYDGREAAMNYVTKMWNSRVQPN